MEKKKNNSVILFAGFLIFFILTFIVGFFVSNDSAPGDPLYGIDRTYEPLQVGLSGLLGGDTGRAEAYLVLADERIEEIETVSEQSISAFIKTVFAQEENTDNVIDELVIDYEDHMNRVEELVASQQENGVTVDELLEKFAERTVIHEQTLLEVYDRVPEQAKDAILRAMEKSTNGRNNAIERLPSQKREEVVEKLQGRFEENQNRRNEFQNNDDINEGF